MKQKALPNKKIRSGRPQKFDEPSRPITLTLPDSTLEGLQTIDPDRSKAIVKLTKAALRQDPSSPRLVEVVEMAADIGLLVVGPSQALRKISFLHLIEVAPTRFLLALDPGNDFKALEIAVHDMVDDLSPKEESERKLLLELLENIRRLRKSERVSMAEILFVCLERDLPG